MSGGIVTGGIVNVGNVNGSVVNADSAVVVDGEHRFGGKVRVCVAGVSVGACEVGTLSGLNEAIDIGAVTVCFSELNVGAFATDTFGVRTLSSSGLEASINVGALSEVSSAFGIKDFRTDCAVCTIFL